LILEHLSQDDINIYRSMPPMPDIDRPRHKLPTAHRNTTYHPNVDPVSEEVAGTDGDRTLVNLKRKKRSNYCPGRSKLSPGGELLPSHPKKPRVTA
jgi:hypothetical protein